MDQHVLQSFPLLVVDLSCPSSGVWPASVAATNATLNCWDVDGDHFASGVAQRSCNPHGSWDAADLSACSTDWTQLELSMLAEAEAELSFVDHWLKKRSVFNYLDYFPGNKIYGETYGDVVPNGCTNGLTYIAGNMLGPAYRRMQFGRMALNEECTHLLNTNWSIGVDIGFQAGGRQVVNEQMVLENNAVTREVGFKSDPSTLNAHVEALSYHGATVLRTVWTVAHEDDCATALNNSCGSELQRSNNSCLTCAKEHVLKLTAAHCLAENNWDDVVKYWCSCDTEGDCGD